MKTSLLFFFISIFIAGNVIAQPIITATDRPVAGDIFNYQQVKSVGVIPGSAGPNQVWNYSGLVDSGSVRLDSFLSVGAAPDVSLFPGTNLVEHGAGVSGNYSYYATNAAGLNILGFLANTDTAYYQPPLQFFNYPFTFGSIFIDSSILQIHSTGFVNSSTYLDSTFVTGFGTLQLPAGVTYTNVLQLIHRITLRTFLGNATGTSISYWTPGIHAPLLTASGSVLGSSPTIEYLKNYIIIVPLKWLNVAAKITGNKAVINWQTVNEINTSHFSVEKSTDGVHFTSLVNVNASTELHAYSAIDNQLQYGQGFYRIMQVDKDGKFSYSPVVSVNFINKLQIKISPNLIRNQFLNFTTKSPSSTAAQLKIISLDGKVQLTKTLSIAAGLNQQQIEVNNLAKGIYFVELNTAGDRQVLKIIKQ